MQQFDEKYLRQLYKPPSDSHKGQNGKLLVIGGSRLFHAASLWVLEIASKIVDMVFYASVPENNLIVQQAKEIFRNGIVIPRDSLEDYINEADCVLIGPGMVRNLPFKNHHEKPKLEYSNLEEINNIKNEGEQSYYLTKYLLEKYPQKKWVIDAGALQMMDKEWLLQLHGNVVVTPHEKEFEDLFPVSLRPKIEESREAKSFVFTQDDKREIISEMAKKYHCIILLKGEKDIVCSSTECFEVSGGNAGMTKGGTGDILAGLVGALACNNELFLSAVCASYINKKAGESLYEKVGYWFNASDLVNEIPKVMKELIL